MIQTRENRRFALLFSTIVAVLTWAVAITVVGLLNCADLGLALRYLGIATFAALGVSALLNRYLWRWPLFKRVLRIPDLSGRWEGWSYRTLTKEWRPSAHEISQEALDIAVNAWGPDNWSRGVCASIVQDCLGGASELIWSYKTESTSAAYQPGDTHSGTHFLRLSEREGHKYLEGRYVTDRVRDDDKTIGAGGFHRLIWVSATFKCACGYDEKSWGMPKPDEPPSVAAT